MAEAEEKESVLFIVACIAAELINYKISIINGFFQDYLLSIIRICIHFFSNSNISFLNCIFGVGCTIFLVNIFS